VRVGVRCFEVGVVERRSEERSSRLEALPRSLPLGSQSCLICVDRTHFGQDRPGWLGRLVGPSGGICGVVTHGGEPRGCLCGCLFRRSRESPSVRCDRWVGDAQALWGGRSLFRCLAPSLYRASSPTITATGRQPSIRASPSRAGSIRLSLPGGVAGPGTNTEANRASQSALGVFHIESGNRTGYVKREVCRGA
jgi:hypothetical protein